MAIIPQQSFFNYDTEVSDYGDLERLRMVIELLPDEDLICILEQKRGKCGRNKFPVAVMWNILLAGYVFQHPTIASLLRELKRNAQLRLVVSGGILNSNNVPSASAMCRFQKSLYEHQDIIDRMFKTVSGWLGDLLPKFGERTAIDSKVIESYASRRSKGNPGDLRGEHEAKPGKKVYSGKAKVNYLSDNLLSYTF